MKLFRYLTPDGKFDYERYRRVQEEGNRRKITARWVHRHVIAFIAGWLNEHVAPLQFGLCHGTRRGDEQAWLRERLGIEVLGTEISSTAADFPHTIQWDFHETKPEWLEAVDFIYSNSHDHSYDPRKCFRAWGACLRVGGVMVLEHTEQHRPHVVNQLDPFGAERDELVAMLNEFGEGAFAVEQVITEFPFAVASHLKQLSLVVVRKHAPMDGRKHAPMDGRKHTPMDGRISEAPMDGG
jgi:hypothetical protein